MAKIGRNEPCPCGSGKKYKHCCSGTEPVRPRLAEAWATDAEWLKIRRTEGELVPSILRFAGSRYGKEFFDEGLEEFGLWGEYEIDEEHQDTIFLPWLAFNRVPETDQAEPGEPEPLPAGLEYLEAHTRSLDQYQQDFIREACAQPYTFFVITDVRPGESMGVRDIFLPRAFTVKEAAASNQLKRGDIVFSRVVQLDGQTIMLGMAPIALPPRHHHSILDARDDFNKRLRKGGFKLNQRLLLEYDLEMRSLYLDLVDLVSNPPRPELRNTDGEPVEFVKLYFKLDCTPEEALAGLKSLSLPEFQDDILADATFDDAGNLIEVTFGWQKPSNRTRKHWDNTTLGTLRIKGNTLTAEVNSEQRAQTIKSEIAQRLKNSAVFQRAVHESVDSKLEEMRGQSDSPGSEEQRKEWEELQSRPDVQAAIKKQIEAHWEAWYNERLPALNNKTPLQAARTRAGRERLEALLVEFERSAEDDSNPNLRVDTAAMREKLGL